MKNNRRAEAEWHLMPTDERSRSDRKPFYREQTCRTYRYGWAASFRNLWKGLLRLL